MKPQDIYEQFLTETGFAWKCVSEGDKQWWWYDVSTNYGTVCVDFNVESGTVEVSGVPSNTRFKRINISDPDCFEVIERVLNE